jgi:2-polyprenyl-3-methyl-5-hydroxy-6-metoxy-1,4-benzoquinol methylase
MVAGDPRAEQVRDAYWRRTFSELHVLPHDHVDYPTAAEQAFTFAAALLACGPTEAMRCLDAGCGKGGFARMLHAAGAQHVTGLDYIDATIQALRQSDPHIRWESGSVCDAEAMASLGIFDVICAIEVLQCVQPEAMFQSLWHRLAPGGRLIGVTPNADNSFVRKRADERPGLYAPLGTAAILKHLRELPELADFGVMGFSWREDRGSVLYDLLPFTSTPAWQQPPKRLLFMARRRMDVTHP